MNRPKNNENVLYAPPPPPGASPVLPAAAGAVRGAGVPLHVPRVVLRALLARPHAALPLARRLHAAAA